MKYQVKVGVGVVCETDDLNLARSIYQRFAPLMQYGATVVLLDISECQN